MKKRSQITHSLISLEKIVLAKKIIHFFENEFYVFCIYLNQKNTKKKSNIHHLGSYTILK